MKKIKEFPSKQIQHNVVRDFFPVKKFVEEFQNSFSVWFYPTQDPYAYQLLQF